MKKLVVLAMVAMLTFNIAGCGKKEEAPATEGAETTETTETTEVTEDVEVVEDVEVTEDAEVEEPAEGASSGNAAMDAYITISQSTFDELAKSLEGMMEFKVSGEGSTLKYEMKLLVDMGDAETAKEQLDLQMETQREEMQTVVESLKAAGVEDPTFIVVYTDKDDAVIAEYTFE